MGNRCVVLFTKGDHTAPGARISPAIYLHWHASAMRDLLTRWRARMVERVGDVDYGAARFIGICHEAIDGALSLGVWNSKPDDIDSHDPGDAGVIIVDVATYIVRRLSDNRSECDIPDRWLIPVAATPPEGKRIESAGQKLADGLVHSLKKAGWKVEGREGGS